MPSEQITDIKRLFSPQRFFFPKALRRDSIFEFLFEGCAASYCKWIYQIKPIEGTLLYERKCDI